MNNQLSIETTRRLLRLRSLLDGIGQTSWSFSILNKRYPIDSLSPGEAQDLIQSYEDLIRNVMNSIKSEYESLSKEGQS